MFMTEAKWSTIMSSTIDHLSTDFNLLFWYKSLWVFYFKIIIIKHDYFIIEKALIKILKIGLFDLSYFISNYKLQ